MSSSTIPSGRPFTVADLEGLPDDGNRYELIDGMLHVSPAPRFQHQLVLGKLFFLLQSECPHELRVAFAPLDVQVDERTSVQPDALVTRFTDFGERVLPVAPLLAVEILSPSTRLYDLNTKKSAYERMGAASYWVLDPAEPGSLTVFELVAGEYTQVAHAVGHEEFAATSPFPVRVVPARLLDGLRP